MGDGFWAHSRAIAVGRPKFPAISDAWPTVAAKAKDEKDDWGGGAPGTASAPRRPCNTESRLYATMHTVYMSAFPCRLSGGCPRRLEVELPVLPPEDTLTQTASAAKKKEKEK